ncbi:hypothetical protein FHS14_001687 [Paenibacillus baekrokdamisoli]|nr:hypothetical protein [Paenibacillus baekrokdamisoli]
MRRNIYCGLIVYRLKKRSIFLFIYPLENGLYTAKAQGCYFYFRSGFPVYDFNSGEQLVIDDSGCTAWIMSKSEVFI